MEKHRSRHLRFWRPEWRCGWAQTWAVRPSARVPHRCRAGPGREVPFRFSSILPRFPNRTCALGQVNIGKKRHGSAHRTPEVEVVLPVLCDWNNSGDGTIVFEQDDTVRFALRHIVDQPQALRLEGSDADGIPALRQSRHGCLQYGPFYMDHSENARENPYFCGLSNGCFSVILGRSSACSSFETASTSRKTRSKLPPRILRMSSAE